MIISPMAGRHDGGGYKLTDPDSDEDRALLCAEAAVALRSWLRRYKAALLFASTPERVIEHVAEALEAIGGMDDDDE